MMSKQLPINSAMLSLLKFVFAIFVILLHAQRLFPQETLHFIQKSLFSRMAVPFFITCSSFMLAVKGQEITSVFKKLGPLYLKLSLLYLPYAFWYAETSELDLALWPLGLILAIFYLGTCYHLWYFPAVLFGLGLDHLLRKRVPQIGLWILYLGFFAFGAIETYSSYLNGSPILSIFQAYQHVFFTSRNGLFYIPIFILLGKSLYQYRQSPFLTKHRLIKLAIAFALILIEGYLVYQRQGYDKNFMFSLIPFTFFLLNWAWRTDLFRHNKWTRLYQHSVHFFFYHPIFIELYFIFLGKTHLETWEKGILVSLMTLVSCYGWSHLLIRWKERGKSKVSLGDQQ